MSGFARPVPSNIRLGRDQLHGRRIERRGVFLTRDPGIHKIGPFLHHVPALMLIFGLVVDAARGPHIFLRKTLLDPVAVETQLVQQGRSGSPQIVDRKGREWEALLLGPLGHRLSTMQRGIPRGVPFFFVRVDRAGNISKRQSATDFHFSRVSDSGPLWNIYEAFAQPGRVLTQIDGADARWPRLPVGRPDGRAERRRLWRAGRDLRHRPRPRPSPCFAPRLLSRDRPDRSCRGQSDRRGLQSV